MQPLIDLLLETVSTRLIATLFRHAKTDFLPLIAESSDGEHHDLGGTQYDNIARWGFMSDCLNSIQTVSSVVLRNGLPSCPKPDTSLTQWVDCVWREFLLEIDVFWEAWCCGQLFLFTALLSKLGVITVSPLSPLTDHLCD